MCRVSSLEGSRYSRNPLACCLQVNPKGVGFGVKVIVGNIEPVTGTGRFARVFKEACPEILNPKP